MKEQIHPVDITVGANIRSIRIMRRMSQEKLADGLGITFQQVQKYEKGTNRVSASRLYDIATIFGVAVGEFFKGTAEIQKTDNAIPALSSSAVRVALDFQKIQSDRSRQAVHNLIRAVINSPADDEQIAA